MNESSYVEHRYLTDDRDLRTRNELSVMWAPNGDYYVSVCPEGEAGIGRSVRICTSGGAASPNPELVNAVRALFEALGGFGEPESA